jgi:hypothetical protein
MTNIGIGFEMCRNSKLFCTNLFMPEKTEFGLWMDRNLNRVIVGIAVVAISVPFLMKSQDGASKRAWVSDEQVLQGIRERNLFIAKSMESGEYDLSEAVKSAPASALSIYDMKIIELPRGYQKKQSLLVLVSQINDSVEQIKSFQSFNDASYAFTDTQSGNLEEKAVAISKK